MHVLLGLPVYLHKIFCQLRRTWQVSACPSWPIRTSSQSDSLSTAQNPTGYASPYGPFSTSSSVRQFVDLVESYRQACPSLPSSISSKSDSSSAAYNPLGTHVLLGFAASLHSQKVHQRRRTQQVCMSFLAFQYILLVKQSLNAQNPAGVHVFLGLPAYLHSQTVRQLRRTQQVCMSFLAFQYIFLVRQLVKRIESGRCACPSWPSSMSSQSDRSSTAQNPAGLHALLDLPVCLPSQTVRQSCRIWQECMSFFAFQYIFLVRRFVRCIK